LKKKKQKFILLVLLLMVAFPIFANSEIGISASLNSNTIWTGTDYYDERSTSNLIGYSLTIPYQYNFNGRISLRTELSYVTKNYTEDTYQNYDNSTTYEYHYNSYVEFPVMGHLYFGPTESQFKPFINFGAYFSYWLTASTTGEYLNISSISGVDTSSDSYYTTVETEGFDDNDNRYNYGLLGGIGFEYEVQRHLKASFETRLTADLTSIYSTDQFDAVDEYNVTIEGNFAFVYSF